MIDALRIRSDARLALVGAGGKTSALFRIGREMIAHAKDIVPTAWLSATTHLAVEQLAYADNHFELDSATDLRQLVDNLPPGAILFTGLQVEANRTAGVDAKILDEIKRLADIKNVPIILEADGSRRLPLKAPAEHEPVIPGWVNQVVVVAGLSALGKPLTDEWVHRPLHFANISGLALGATITRAALANVLAHPMGGLKGIPPQARRGLITKPGNHGRATGNRAVDSKPLTRELSGSRDRRFSASGGRGTYFCCA